MGETWREKEGREREREGREKEKEREVRAVKKQIAEKWLSLVSVNITIMFSIIHCSMTKILKSDMKLILH